MDIYKEDKGTVDSISSLNVDNVYDKYASLVYRTLLHYSEDKDVAEDLLQEVFVKLLINVDNVSAEAIKAWLLTTAKNMTLNYRRNGQYEVADSTFFDDTNELLATECLEDEFIAILKNIEYRALTDKIFAELYRKNVRWYDAITITYLLEKPKKETAEIMGISPDLLYKYLSRARKWIGKRYREEYDRLRDI